MNAAALPVPSFGLFGEDVGEEFSDFFHWETIEARSAGYEWEISTHRHPGLFQVLFLQRGTSRIRLDAKAHTVAAPALVFVPPGRTHGFRFSDPTDGLVLTGRSTFTRLLGETDPLRPALLRSRLAIPPDEAAVRLAELGRQLLLCEAISPDSNRTAMRANLAEAWLRLAVSASESAERGDGGSSLVERFKALVESHSREHWTIQAYADALGCTSRTLARATQGELGLSPLQYVNRRVATEARRLLNFSNANVAQVAAALGFDDPSYFSRFYLRMSGRRPSAERKRAAN